MKLRMPLQDRDTMLPKQNSSHIGESSSPQLSKITAESQTFSLSQAVALQMLFHKWFIKFMPCLPSEEMGLHHLTAQPPWSMVSECEGCFSKRKCWIRRALLDLAKDTSSLVSQWANQMSMTRYQLQQHSTHYITFDSGSKT